MPDLLFGSVKVRGTHPDWHLTLGNTGKTVCGISRGREGWLVVSRGLVGLEWAEGQPDVCGSCKEAAKRMDQVTELSIGPFLFMFHADGDDDGVGDVHVLIDGDYRAPLTDVSRVQWDQFVTGATL